MGTVSFWLVSLSVLMVFLDGSADMGEICNPPSSCGSLHNISYPFRLKTDPINCGHHSYELSCECNQTLLYLNSMKFYVDSISYNQRKIRVVDSTVERDNCSSLPRFLGRYDIPYPFYRSDLVDEITYVNCSVSKDTPNYLATAPCFNSSSFPYFYVMVGYMTLSDLNLSCAIQSSAPIEVVDKSQNLSYTDIHNALLMGFDLDWFQPPQTLPSVSCERPFRSAHCIVKTILQHLHGLLMASLPIIGRIMIVRTSIGMFCLVVLLIYKLWREHLSKDENVQKFISKYKSQIPLRDFSDVKKMALHFKVKLEYTVTEFFIEHKSKDENIEDFLNRYKNHVPMRYSYSNVKKMTHGFKEKLGQGGYVLYTKESSQMVILLL